ncbi:MAG: hypothetical protein C0506_01770 [Anaerolinea sp.]|nr:hypothetical protein [Anaerolinea sp.]
MNTRQFRRLGVAPALITVLAILVTSCTGGDEVRVEKVFTGPPWSGDEVSHYNLIDSGGEVYGTCSLETRPEFEPGKTKLSRLCGDGPNRDDGTAVVDARTLKPYSAIRVISDGEKNKRTTFTASYGEDSVRFTADSNGKLNETERDLPKPDETSPDPGWYDDESLLWLVRGIDLKQGYEAAYKNVNAGNGRVFSVELKVETAEKVKVPAGEFRAWKVRIRTDSITQYAWVGVEAPHTLIRARIERLTYELTGSE